MEKEFVPYTESLELKQLGFDEPCLGAWAEHGFMTPNDVSTLQDDVTIEDIKNTQDENMCLSPLYQQAFRWFREYQDWPIESWIQPYLSDKPRQHEAFYWRRGETISIGIFSTYEEAELACLRKLINLVKQKP
jgi:hypothetical protein